jgi:hypothetical protein
VRPTEICKFGRHFVMYTKQPENESLLQLNLFVYANHSWIVNIGLIPCLMNPTAMLASWDFNISAAQLNSCIKQCNTNVRPNQNILLLSVTQCHLVFWPAPQVFIGIVLLQKMCINISKMSYCNRCNIIEVEWREELVDQAIYVTSVLTLECRSRVVYITTYAPVLT